MLRACEAQRHAGRAQGPWKSNNITMWRTVAQKDFFPLASIMKKRLLFRNQNLIHSIQ